MKISLSHVIAKVFAQQWKKPLKLRLFYSVLCWEWILSLHAAPTPYIKQGPQTAIASPLGCEVVLEEYKMASQGGEFSWHCCWDSYQSLPQQYGWEGWKQRQRNSLWFSSYFRLLITHHGSEKLATKLTLVSRCTKKLFLSFPYLRQKSLSQGQGPCVPKILLGSARFSLPAGG